MNDGIDHSQDDLTLDQIAPKIISFMKSQGKFALRRRSLHFYFLPCNNNAHYIEKFALQL